MVPTEEARITFVMLWEILGCVDIPGVLLALVMTLVQTTRRTHR
jgi:hypothetical protein